MPEKEGQFSPEELHNREIQEIIQRVNANPDLGSVRIGHARNRLGELSTRTGYTGPKDPENMGQPKYEEGSPKRKSLKRNASREIRRQASKLVEHQAEIIAMARIDSARRQSPIGYHYDIVNRGKERALAEKDIKLGTSTSLFESTSLCYKGKWIIDPLKFIRDYPGDEAVAKMNKSRKTRFNARRWEEKKAEFEDVPQEAIDAYVDWYDWYFDSGPRGKYYENTGHTLDIYKSAGLVSQEQYDRIIEARDAGQMIIYAEFPTAAYDTDISQGGVPDGRIHVWAIADKSKTDSAGAETA